MHIYYYYYYSKYNVTCVQDNLKIKWMEVCFPQLEQRRNRKKVSTIQNFSSLTILSCYSHNLENKCEIKSTFIIFFILSK